MNQIDIPDYQYYLNCYAKRLVRLLFLEKKGRFSIGNFDSFAYSIFKNKEISTGQGVVQSEPNWYPRLPLLFTLLCEKKGPPNFPKKKLVLHTESCNYFK